MSDDLISRETERLKRTWNQRDPAMLRDYLVSDVEDPRLNAQSILSRHFLIESLFGRRFADLMKEELRFAIVMNWLLKLLKQPAVSEDFQAILHALEKGSDDAEGLPIPPFISEAWRAVSTQQGQSSNYLAAALTQTQFGTTAPTLAASSLETFQRLWAETLLAEAPRPTSLLEPACGSANDFRFLHAFGLARLLDYTGIDLCEHNILNANELFPKAHFAVGNVLQLEWPDRAFDLCMVHDLFEHLSIDAMECAVAEVCRVTREGICANFFSMFEAEEHIVREIEEYHWNTLSLNKVCRLFAQRGFSVQVIHIDTFLKWRFGCDQTHNKNAYTLLFRK